MVTFFESWIAQNVGHGQGARVAAVRSVLFVKVRNFCQRQPVSLLTSGVEQSLRD